MVEITCVIDNTASFGSKFHAEHGLSILIEDNDEKILFDTGRTPEILKYNLSMLNGFDNLKYIVLSHGHHDHVGGLPAFLKQKDLKVIMHRDAPVPGSLRGTSSGTTKVIMHRDAPVPKYVIEDKKIRFAGFSLEKDDILDLDFRLISKTTKIMRNVWIFTPISKRYEFEEIDPSFVLKKDGKFIKDRFEDEIVLVIRADRGLVVISGCAHSGILNIISSVKEYFDDEVKGIIGGIHLTSSSFFRLRKTVDEMKNFKVDLLALGHCTGLDAICMLKEKFENKFQLLESGKRICGI